MPRGLQTRTRLFSALNFAGASYILSRSPKLHAILSLILRCIWQGWVENPLMEDEVPGVLCGQRRLSPRRHPKGSLHCG